MLEESGEMYSNRGQKIRSFKPGNQMECDQRNLPEAPGTHQVKFSEKNKPSKASMMEITVPNKVE
jgi:hypothetical protein